MFWGLAIVAILVFAFAFTSHSPGWMGFGIFVGLVCAIAAALVFIDRHLRASSRPEHLTQAELNALRDTLKRPAPPRQLPPGDQH